MANSLHPRNRLLAALPPQAQKRILSKLTTVSLKVRDELYRENQPIENVYFPLSGVMSLVTTSGGEAGEVATVGNEGMLGLPIFFRTDRIPMRAFAQIAGEALMMSVKDFKNEIKDPKSPLTNILYPYAQAVFNQVAQHAVCNAIHHIRQRCARWLLMTHDRVNSDEFSLTQDLLSQMLGVRRASVSTAAADLQKDKLITYRRGNIKILDRKGLEKASCDHYHVVRAEYERLHLW
jgi:CRP-like cAMP-binding protein